MGQRWVRPWDGHTLFTGATLLACASLLAVTAGVALAAPGDLDSGFGTGGKTTIDFGGTDRATHVALTPDGRIVVLGLTSATGGGDFAVVRLRSNGTPDPTFNGTGRESVSTGPTVNDIGGGVVVQPDEKIIVSGQGNATQDFVIKSLNPDGSLDTSFGSGGTTSVDFGGDDIPNQMIRQPDGKLVLVGATGSAGNQHFAVARLNADGSPDTSFGSGGKTTIDFGGDDTAYGVAVQPDGKLVIAGQGDPDHEMAVARLNADGTLDTSFGTDGEATVASGGTSGGSSASAAYALALEPDGKIVLTGSNAIGRGYQAVARLNTNGTLDTSFGAGYGVVSLNYGASIPELALGIVVQPDGKLVVLGNGGVNNDFVLTRLSSAGVPDSGFGSGGALKVDFGGTEYDGDLVQQADGKFVLAGSTDVHDGGDIAVARVLGDASGGGGGTIGGAGSPPPDPTLHISVKPTNPIATKRTAFTFTVTQYGRPRSGVTVRFDGAKRQTNGIGQAKYGAALELHSYVATASLAGAPGGSVTITPRFVPHVFISVAPGRPRFGAMTTFTFHATLEGRPPLGRSIPARNAYISFDGMLRRTSVHGPARFRVFVSRRTYTATVTRANALSTSLTIRSTTVFSPIIRWNASS
jgi:uncharacterized delta-60 repeat protein